MGLKEILSSLFDTEEKEKQIHVDDAAELFEKQREKEIKKARERQEDLREITETILADLKDSLKLVKSFEDNEDLNIVEDVAESFYIKRKNQMEDLELSEDFKPHIEEFSDFVDDFNDVSRKEGAVLNRIEKQGGSLQSSIESMIEHKEKLQEFQQEETKVLERLEEVEKDLEDIENYRKSLEETENKIDNLEEQKKKKKEDLKENEEELNRIKDSDEMDELEELEEEIENVEEERDSLESSINQDLCLIERGLKKALYEIENNNADFSGNTEDLRKLLDKKTDSFDAVDSLREVKELIQSKSLLEDRQLEKFDEGVENLSELSERKSQIEELNNNIEDLKSQKREFNVKNKKEELENDIKELEDEIEDLSSQVSDLRSKRDSVRDSFVEKVSSIEKGLNSHLSVKVELETDFISRRES